MPENWKTYKLSELTSVITKGTTPSTYGFDFEDSGITYIRAQSLNYDGKIDEDVFSFISEEAHEKLKRSQLKEGDLLFSMAGAYLGMTGMVKASHCPANTNQAVGIIRINNEEVDRKFVEYLLRNPSTISYVNSQSGQSAQPNINLAEIGNLVFEYPILKEQKAIASILSTIDDKIELNLQQNKTLEEMAMALYKHWFVDFDFPSEALAKDGSRLLYRSSGGKFIDSELGLIPEGWEVLSLDQISNVKGGKRLPKGFQLQEIKNNHPYIRVRDFNSTYLKSSVMSYVPDEAFGKISNYIVNTGDVALTIVGTIGRVSLIGPDLDLASLTENCVKISELSEISAELIYLHLQSSNGQNEIMSKTVGSTQPKLPIYNIKSLQFVLPVDRNILIPVSKELSELFELMYNNIIENQTLTTLRNSLLPKLINGEVRVKDIEQEISKVL
jgi:type I restriction enzyme S subunit